MSWGAHCSVLKVPCSGCPPPPSYLPFTWCLALATTFHKVGLFQKNSQPFFIHLTCRGHDNVHDDMNMYVIMHDQCLFIAMINIFHIWSIALHSMNGTFMHESAWSMIITINVHSLGYDHWSLTIRVIKFHVWTCCSWGYDHWTEDEKPPLPCVREFWAHPNFLHLELSNSSLENSPAVRSSFLPGQRSCLQSSSAIATRTWSGFLLQSRNLNIKF